MKQNIYNKVRALAKGFLPFYLFTLLPLVTASCTDDDRIPDVTSATCPSSIELQVPADLQKLIYTDNTGADVLPLIVGETAQLGFVLEPADATFKDVLWTSSESSVASVTENGLVEALSEKGLGYSISTAPANFSLSVFLPLIVGIASTSLQKSA